MSEKSPGVARYVVAIGAGKGGVGKSTISLNLALALRDHGKVGLLDADVYGPNIPLFLNFMRRRPASSWYLWRSPEFGGNELEPLDVLGMRVFSLGFAFGEDQPLSWPATLVAVLIEQIMRDVLWGALDFLVVDLPPGTGDVQQALIKQMPVSGVVLVVTPQDAAHLDARKALKMFRDEGVSVLGAIENMSGTTCPQCGKRIEVFRPVRAERSIWNLGVEKLAEVPLDPKISECGDAGRPIVAARPDSWEARIFTDLARTLRERLENTPA